MSNFDEFKNFLIEHNLPFTEETEEEYSAIIFTETVENGPKVRIYFAFMNNDNLVSAYVFDYIELEEDSDRTEVLEHLNKLNLKHTYFKFLIDSYNKIVITAHQYFVNNFSTQVTFAFLTSILRVMKDEYPELKNIIKPDLQKDSL